MTKYVKEFESFVISDKRPETLDSIIPNSEAEYFLKIISALNNLKEDDEFPQEISSILTKLKEKSASAYKELRLISLLKQYDLNSTSLEEKQSIINYIKDEYFSSVTFDYPNPSTSNSLSQISENNSLTSVIDEKPFDMNTINEMYNPSPTCKFSSIKEISPAFLTSIINFEKVNEKVFNFAIMYLDVPMYEFNEITFKRFADFAKSFLENSKSFDFKRKIKSMTVKQIEYLINNINDPSTQSELLSNLLNKLFSDRYKSTVSNSDKYEILLEMYDFIKDKNYSMYVKNEILFELLRIGLYLNNLNINHFLEYISSPYSCLIKMSVRKPKEEFINLIYSLGLFPLISDDDKTEILSNYIRVIFLENLFSFENLSQILDSQFIKKEYFTACTLKGEENEECEKFFGQNEYEKMIKKSEITFCNHNPQILKLNEPVVIELDIKNVNSLLVQVFEINSENYYYTKRTVIDSLISIEGFCPTHEYSYSFNEKPQILKRRKISLDKIANKRGIYIVDFIGNGVSSRAVLKIGSLSMISKVVKDGLIVNVLDEDCNICSSEKTGIWIKNQFYSVEKETGNILIPFMISTERLKVVIVHNGYADIADLEVLREIYYLDCTFLVNHESLIPNNNIEVLCRPNIQLHSFRVDPKCLKDTKITVTMQTIENDVDVSISQVFDQLEVNNNSEIAIKLRIPAKLRSLGFKFEAEIFRKSEGEYRPLSFQQSYCLETKDEENQFVKFFLRKINNNYVIKLLGKNGEPKENQKIILQISHKFLSKLSDQSLITDKSGEVYLGQLEFINSINVSTNYMERNITQEFLFLDDDKYLYPENIDISLGETITLPIMINSFDKTISNFNLNFLLTTSNRLDVISNEIDCVKLVRIQENNYCIEIKPRSLGCYSLFLKHSNNKINVNVHKGKPVLDNRYYLTSNNKLITFNNNKQLIRIEKVNIINKENSKLSDIEVLLNGQSKNARIHLFANQFLYKYPKYMKETINNLLYDCTKPKICSLNTWQNVFLSNKQLNEEFQYVLERRNLSGYQGNSLEKPSLLLKRQFNRDTVTSIHNVKEGSSYESSNFNQSDVNCFFVKTLTGKTITGNIDMDCLVEDLKAFIYEKEGIPVEQQRLIFNGKEMINGNTLSYYGFTKNCTANLVLRLRGGPESNMHSSHYFNLTFSNFHGFLLNSPLIISNVIVENGKAIIKGVNLSEYSNIQILAIDEDSSFEENIDLNNINVNCRNLALDKALNIDKNFSELREIETFKKNDLINIDLNSMNLKIVDNLEMVAKYYTTLNQGLIDDWNSLKFLLYIDKQNNEENIQNFSKFFSHELNLYLYFKHHDLFENFCLPILKFKFEKTFIDYFLMNDKTTLLTYLKPNKLAGLNALEKCLLIYSFKYDNDKSSFLKNLVINMKANANSNMPSQQQIKRQFYVMMKMKQLSENECNVGEDNQNSEMRKKQKSEVKPEVKNIEMTSNQNNKKVSLLSKIECSKEYKETHYFFEKMNKNSSINNNSFWADLAEYFLDNSTSLSNNFLSKNFVLDCRSTSEMIFRLAFLDLPCTKPIQNYEKDESSVNIKASSNMFFFSYCIKETQKNIKSELMIAQNIYPLLSKEDNNVSEFIQNYVYVHETIITNISSKKINFELLVQIPEGSIPVLSSDYTKTVNLSLDKYATTSIKTNFYFISLGEFTQYPPSASIQGVVVSKGQPTTYKVKNLIKKEIFENLDEILSTGTKDDIVKYITRHQEFSSSELSKIYWLLKDKEFFKFLYNLLLEKGIYDENVWKYGFYHFHESVIKEFIEKDENILALVGIEFQSKLLSVNRTDLKETHFDYYPLLNSRVHRIGPEDKHLIMNNEFRETYERFIISMIKKKDLNSYDWLRLCYYLILQDRVDEALNAYNKTNVKEFSSFNSLQVQYDYISAYLNFTYGYPDYTVAKEMYEKNKNFPLKYWKELFEELNNQINDDEQDDYYNENNSVDNQDSFGSKQGIDSFLNEPALSFNIKDRDLCITYSNISTLTIRIYQIELEILFSKTPFIKEFKGDFNFIQPNFMKIIEVTNSTKTEELVIPIEDEYSSKNLFIEISSKTKKCFQAYYSNNLKVIIYENLGEVKVLDKELKPLSNVYVKCFSMMNDNSITFYKDGYTDKRGRFNYVKLNTDQIKNFKRFSLFISELKNGSLVRECDPPKDMIK